MIRGRRITCRILLLGFAVFIATPAAEAHKVSSRAKTIGSKLQCMCGACQMTASGCSHPGGEFSGPCLASAQPELREIDDLLTQGKTEQQIIDAFVAKYGPGVYVEPPTKGFGLVAWIMPTAYLAFGTVLVIFVIAKWRQRNATLTSASASAAGPAISPELLDRVRALAARETED